MGVLPVAIGGLSVDVTEIVTGSGPQSNVMIPPPLTALDSAWNVQLDAVPVPTTVVAWLVSTGSASAGNVSVVQEPVGFPATGTVPASPLPLDSPPEAPDSLDALPELAAPLVDPEPARPPPEPPPFEPLPLAPAPIDPLPAEPAPIDPLPAEPAPIDPLLLDPAPPAPLTGLLPEPVPADEAPALWPAMPFASEPLPLPQPMPNAAQRDNESRIRSVHIGLFASKVLPQSIRQMRAVSFCTMSYRGAAEDTCEAASSRTSSGTRTRHSETGLLTRATELPSRRNGFPVGTRDRTRPSG
jgi:hypothetical protein